MNWKPPTIPPRKPGWEHAYAAELQEQARMPFAWGKADCLTRVADLCKAMTGVNPLPMAKRRYTTERGALRQMAKLGFASIEDALAAVFPDVPKAKARRGDCGVAEVRVNGEMTLSTFIVTGVTALGSDERGPVVIPTLALKRTFAVG